ncbi:protease modulator HflC [Metallibacterium sp.]|jgi:membrane protease subunit HflC|uniref:protease modulator HflC n=1 Tax=Metallibacterium sp. TaxID=2940281 RepID=UPI00261423B7|nr:protease modulator HflC [Metallibacterium sp.]
MSKPILIAIAVLLVLLGYNSMFTVRQDQSALLLQFGRIVRSNYKPGLHFKLPFVQEDVKFDKRILTLNAQPERYFTAEKKVVNVDFYVKWRVANPALFYQSTAGSETQAEARLSPMVKDALRFEFSALPLDELVSGGRNDVTKRVRDQANTSAMRTLGVQIVDVRIKQIDLPESVSESVFKRMSAERMSLANALRSSGEEAAAKIRADADKQAQVLVAQADSQASELRGQGDAQAAETYAKAYGQDPKFFVFYRSLEAYRRSFGQGHGVLLLKPNSEFLHYFDAPGQ